MAFARIADQRFIEQEQVVRADYVIVLDPKILETARPLSGGERKSVARS